MTKRQADLALLLATALWGTSFVAVKRALADATPLAFLALRFGIAALLLAPATRFRPLPGAREWRGGLLLGALVAAGFVTQTVGLVTTTPSRSAFIVAVSSILAPVIALALLGRRPAWPVAAALAVATLGIYLLTAPDGGGLTRGARLHGGVREHRLLLAPDARAAAHVAGAGRAHLLLRAALRRAHVVAR